MSTDDLIQIERLFRLRESGGLTQTEYEAEKAKLFALNGQPTDEASSLKSVEGPVLECPIETRNLDQARTRRWVSMTIVTALGAMVLGGAIATGMWVRKDRQTQAAAEGSSDNPVTTVTPTTQPLPIVKAKSPAMRLSDAFAAATGHRHSFDEEVDGNKFTNTPIKIIDLSFGPVLLTNREIKDGCDGCRGYIGVYYLRENGQRTTVTGSYPKAVEGLAGGAVPNDWHLTERFTTFPAIYSIGSYSVEGITLDNASITELRPEGAITSDIIPISFSNEGEVDDDHPLCEIKGRITNVVKDQSFDVPVSGSIAGLNHYDKRAGRFVAVTKIDWDNPCAH